MPLSSLQSRQERLQAGLLVSCPEKTTRWQYSAGRCRWSRELLWLNASGTARRRCWSLPMFVLEVRIQRQFINVDACNRLCSPFFFFTLKVSMWSRFQWSSTLTYQWTKTGTQTMRHICTGSAARVALAKGVWPSTWSATRTWTSSKKSRSISVSPIFSISQSEKGRVALTLQQ